jgi:hypothetical protein
MRWTCIKCDKDKHAGNGSRKVMLQLGWDALLIAGESYWRCPTCSGKTENYCGKINQPRRCA